MSINSIRLEIVRAWYKTIENITNNYLGSVVEGPINWMCHSNRARKEHALLESFTTS